VSPLAAVPKGDGGVRVCDDATNNHAGGESANMRIRAKIDLQLTHTMDAAKAIRKLRYQLGSNCELGMMKIDIKAAYRLLRTEKEQAKALLFVWGNVLYQQAALEFGVATSAAHFSRLSLALQ